MCSQIVNDINPTHLNTHLKDLHIGIDLMGADHSAFHLFQAVETALQYFPSVHFIIYVVQNVLDDIKSKYACAHHPALTYVVAPEFITMQDDPLISIRQKKTSSLMLGLKQLKKQQLHGLITAGNTGALIAGATLSLPLLPKIQRPALLAILPTQKGQTVVIDVGGNVSCKPQHLMQFAHMGIAYVKCMNPSAIPRVGLLNIGIESKKGTSEIRQAYQLLQQQASAHSYIFAGNVEGSELFEGIVDVLVTDGFTGNVLLKTSEGVSSFMLQQFKQLSSELQPSNQEFEKFYHQFNDKNYKGAIVCGVDSVVIKCHGKSSAQNFFNGIKQGIQLIQNDFVLKFKSYLNSTSSS